MYLSDVSQRGKVLKLRYVSIRSQSTRKSVKVARCIYDMSVNEEKCQSFGMYLSNVSQRGNVLKLRYVYITYQSTRKSVKVAVCIYQMSLNQEMS